MRAVLRSVSVTLLLMSAAPACSGGKGGGPEPAGSPTPFPDPTPAARLASWRGAALGAFAFDHVVLEGTAVRISPSGGLDGEDTENLYGGVQHLYGSVLSPEIPVTTAFREAIVSWEASTPPRTWIQVNLSARIGGTWTREYNLGIWSAGNEAFARHSVAGQADAAGTVYTDTLVLAADADAFRLRATLFAAQDAGATPRLHALAVVTTKEGSPVPPLAVDPAAYGIGIDVPMRSQMIYAGGGEVWCSPTATSMVVAHWANELGDAAIAVPVPDAADATYDATYAGTGNWPFNTAWAATRGDGALRAFVTRLWRVEQLERLTKAGFPVVVSGSWSSGGMTGSPLDSTQGHVFVVRGFDAAGDVLVNEPAAADDASVRHTYDRAEFDAAWAGSGRTVYLIHPADRPLPAEGALGAW